MIANVQALQLIDDDSLLVKRTAISSLAVSLHAVPQALCELVVCPLLSSLLQKAALYPKEAAEGLNLDKSLISLLEQVDSLHLMFALHVKYFIPFVNAVCYCEDQPLIYKPS